MNETTREKEIAVLMMKALESIGLTKKVVKENCNLNEKEYENYLYCLNHFVNEVISSKFNDMEKQNKEYSNVYENYKINDRQYNFTFNGLYNDIVSCVTKVKKEGE